MGQPCHRVCTAPTLGLDLVTDPRVPVYVGLYSSGGKAIVDVHLLYYVSLGDIGIANMSMNILSDLNGNSPKFTLTCISTEGPATTVTWTRYSTTVTEGTGTVLDDPVTAQYTHTLTVTTGGEYTCTVSNNKPSMANRSIVVAGKIILIYTKHTIIINGIYSCSTPI